ncbi:hypothetical protein ARMSODRAFT_392185 [Armillaria solidipes]|uniref:Uncharacterized protein n=1 Tax=Armillaria solidipes TaxID=1076256 RepID=A0A2H3CHA5_9AGAR|nr:hypothetical protein ARMSODRAFT_392185 [Armillaria solidipes]
MTTFPPELVEIIISKAWHSEMPSSIRTSFMTACPLVNRTWKAAYAPIASRDLYITNLAYIYYLCNIARRRKSIIYYNFIPRLTRTITCFIDLGGEAQETAVERVYHILIKLPNDVGLKALFPLVPYISFEFGWIGTGRNPLSPQLCDIPIHVRVYYHRYLSITEGTYLWQGRTRMDVGISMTDSDPLRHIHRLTWTETWDNLGKIKIIGGGAGHGSYIQCLIIG